MVVASFPSLKWSVQSFDPYHPSRRPTSPSPSFSAKSFSCAGEKTGSYQHGGGFQLTSVEETVPCLPPVGPLTWVTLIRDWRGGGGGLGGLGLPVRSPPPRGGGRGGRRGEGAHAARPPGGGGGRAP